MFMVKPDLKDAYFTVPVRKGYQKFWRFIWKETLWEFACLPFGLASVPPDIHQDHETRCCNSSELGDSSYYISGRSSHSSGFRAVFQTPPGNSYESPREFGVYHQPEKVNFNPSADNRIPGYVRGFSNPVSCPSSRQSQKYLQGVRRPDCQPSYDSTAISPSLTPAEPPIQAVFPAPPYYRYLQQAMIQALRWEGHYESQVFLNQEAIEELQWLADNLMFWNGRDLAQPDPNIVVEIDASKEGWGAHCSFAIECFAKDKQTFTFSSWWTMWPHLHSSTKWGEPNPLP